MGKCKVGDGVMRNTYRITIIEWENQNTCGDTIYVDYLIKIPKFRKLEKAIKYVETYKDRLLALSETNGHIAIDVNIEEWYKDAINGIAYTTNLWERS